MSHDYDPHDQIGQMRQAERDAALAKERETRLIADVKWLMQGPRGRRFLRALLDHTGAPHGDPFDENAVSMARNVGRQSVGRWIYQLILDHAQAEFPLLLKDDNDDRNAN